MAKFAFLAFVCLCLTSGVFCEPSYQGKTYIDPGETFYILCRIPLTDPLRLQWTLNDKIIGPILYRGLTEDLEEIDWDIVNKGHDPVEFIVEDAFRENDEGQHILSRLIVPKAKIRHSGSYRCNDLFRKGHRIVVGQEDQVTSDSAPVIIESRSNHPVILACNATTNADAKVEWFKDEVKIQTDEEGRLSILPGNHSLKITKPSASNDAGTYRCKLALEDMNLAQSNPILLKFPLKVKIEQGISLNVIEGEKMRLVCNVTGGTFPKIVWFKDNKTLPNSDDLSGRVTFKPHNDVENVELFIAEADMDDRGTYTCEATSQIDGSSETETASDSIIIRVKDKLAALYPFLGICAEVAILCTIIFIYERKRSKAEQEEEAENVVEEKNTADGVKDSEVRHRNK